MCYTGGPRCFKDAKNALVNARRDYQNNPTEENKAAFKEAQRDIALTPEYISNLEHTDPEQAASLQKVYDQKLAGAKEYERFRSESGRTLARLNEERDSALAQVEAIDKKIEAHDRHIEYVNMDNLNGGIYSDDEEADYQRWQHSQDTSKLEDEKKTLLERSGILKKQIDTVSATNEENLARRKSGLPINHSHLMPAKFAGYFADTERKHFSASSEGSTFTEAKNLNDVLSRAAEQRKNLEGDDREKLIALGADPSSFAADKRYLMVETKGTVGTILASELPDTTQVSVVQKSEKAKPVCVATVKSQKETDHATIVLADNPTLPGTENHPTLLITAFPGVSGPSGSNDDLLPYVGKSMSIAEARKIYGRDFSINTIVK
jgi:hypothetical protein